MRGLLRYLNRRRLGQTPLYLEYAYDFLPRWERAGHEKLMQLIEGSAASVAKNLSAMTQLLPQVKALDGDSTGSLSMDWGNSFMPVLDGLSVMWAVRNAPKLYIEIGSGNSTVYAKAAADSNKTDVRIVSVDPYPRRDIDVLCDELIRQPLETVDLSLFERLEAGDALFFDGSHRSFMNSDVTVFMLEVLPRIRKGVVVGLHDIFLPFDYPTNWRERGYNEQYLLAAILLANPDYAQLLLCNHWLWRKRMHEEALGAIWDVVGENARDRAPSAFWMVKN